MDGSRIAVTMGDPTGSDLRWSLEACTRPCLAGMRFIVIGEFRVLEAVRDRLGISVDLVSLVLLKICRGWEKGNTGNGYRYC